MARQLVLLGSTGSIGTQTLSVIKQTGYQVLALSAHKNVELLEQQAREFLPRYAAVTDKEAFEHLKTSLADTSVKVLYGVEGLCEIASLLEADLVLNAVIGMVGLRPTLAAIEAGTPLALANKETLVAGGALVMDAAHKKQVPILPVDSEHSAIFQCLQARGDNDIRKLILTASGGPFFGKSRRELEQVTVQDALNHPNWSMGAKITVDSATMMNKGLELIEAVWLFGVTPSQVEVVVHRESILHSAVEFPDHSVIAQMGIPDMKLPIQYAMTYPNRLPCDMPELDLAALGAMTFHRPDEATFGLLPLARTAIETGGLLPCIVNAANEEAVAAFLGNRIRFLEIEEMVQRAAQEIENRESYTLSDVSEKEIETRMYVKARLRN